MGALRTIPQGNYNYVILPFDFEFDPQFLTLCRDIIRDEWLSPEIKKKIKKIFTIESKGIPLATILGELLNIPIFIARKRQYGLPGECTIKKRTGYAESRIYINGICPGENGILLVDDIISTGGTLDAILSWMYEENIEVNEVWTIFSKINNKDEISGRQLITEKYSLIVRSLIELKETGDGTFNRVVL